MKERIKKVGPFVGVAVLVFFAGFGVSQILNAVRASSEEAKFSLLAKRTQVESPRVYRVNFTDLRRNLESYVKYNSREDQKISLYFEYLPSGISIHINEENTSIAASLMKVPIVMTLYKQASEGKIDLDKKVALKEEWLNSEYGSLYKKGEGYELTIREAAKLTLRDSDNTAILLIYDQIGPDAVNDSGGVVNFLDLEYDLTSDERVMIGAQSYSSILKCLYLACYNSKEDSQEILQYLTESTYFDRLTNKIPEDVLVAHKIGTFSEEYQSDCGIFYVPDSKYLLCVMVKGKDPASSQLIAEISSRIYNYIVSEANSSSN